MRPSGYFDVIVATHRRPVQLSRLLDALDRQTLPKDHFRRVVVNDGSHDERYARVVAGRDLLYQTLPRRRGPAAARNAAVRLCAGPWLVFTDDDCVPPPTWLERLDEISARSTADLIAGPALPLPGERLGVLGRYLRDSSFLRPARFDDGAPCGLPTANLALRRELFKRAGGFDERFPCPGGEDFELTYRLIAAGARVELSDDWTVYHPYDCTLAEFVRRFYRYGYGETLWRRPGPPRSRLLRLRRLLAGTLPPAERTLPYQALTLSRELCLEAGRLAARCGLRGAD